jgi:putative endonuclease
MSREHLVNSTSTGKHPVTLVRSYLQSRGITVLDQSWKYSLGDLDLVAADHGALVICAVQVRKPGGSRDPRLSPQKTQLLRRLAMFWQQAHGTRYDRARVDLAVVTWEGTGGYTIEHIQEAGQR